MSDNGNDHFGDVTDVSPLAGMDGLLGVSAYDADKNCTCLFVSSKATPYQSIPTMVGSMISIRIKNRKFYQNQYAFCNQLLTAPATPLFPSLESESHKIFMNQNGDSKDHHPNAPKFRVRTTINEAFRCWCQACWQYSVEYPLSSILNSDVTNNPSEGVFVGLLLPMSLTTVVLKFLMEKNSVNALHRKLMCPCFAPTSIHHNLGGGGHNLHVREEAPSNKEVVWSVVKKTTMFHAVKGFHTYTMGLG
ncbi:unnamed protein product [Lactuca saligna]|uniref:Uncharacterized protein n=1 Tax=Lactuca saligna TaxID=75948 RepID=A0AA36EBE5_LACSI|nr:unnamed protein product [Lactuca saligna]